MLFRQPRDHLQKRDQSLKISKAYPNNLLVHCPGNHRIWSMLELEHKTQDWHELQTKILSAAKIFADFQAPTLNVLISMSNQLLYPIFKF